MKSFMTILALLLAASQASADESMFGMDMTWEMARFVFSSDEVPTLDALAAATATACVEAGGRPDTAVCILADEIAVEVNG